MDIGFELLYSSVFNNIIDKEDALVVVLHWFMLKNGKKCVGSGDEWEEVELPKGSELLPSSWNKTRGIYTLRYVNGNALPGRFLMKIVKSGSSLIINVVDIDKDKAGGMSANVNNYVNDPSADRSFAKIYKNLEELSAKFQKEVLENVSPNVVTSTVQNDTEPRSQVPDDIWKPVIPFSSGIPASDFQIPDRSFPRIGDRDLDPLGGIGGGGSGGGMVMDPPHPNLFRNPEQFSFPDPFGNPRPIPRGSVPPGARFDPFSPPSAPRPRFGQFPQRPRTFGPDPDHLPPPDTSDMYM